MLGTTLSHYRITAKLGEGGMGEVWRATDEQLGREVALKVLPTAFTQDPDRLARFEREARVLAQLNHPRIAQIYGLETSGETPALVMELVEGPTLADRIEAGPLRLEESLAIARQIATALEAAHEKGIVHRDLKPANIKVGPDGEVKILDFGLAKAMEPKAGDGSASQLAHSPTLTFGETAQGVILGTAAYMAPEQAKGAAADKRADIWAFGVVLFEMLTGRRLLEGESVPEILGSLFRQEIALDELPAETPAPVRRLLARCLVRDPKQRLRDIGDARLELETTHDEEARTVSEPAPRRQLLPIAAFLAGAVLATLAAWWLLRGEAPPPPPVTRFSLQGLGVPIDAFQGLALSPDGTKLVYRARDEQGDESLNVRSLDSFQVTPLPGTDFGWLPFFSPDGERVGLMSSGQLKTVSVTGSSPRTLAALTSGFSGGTWLPNGDIVYSAVSGRHLYRVPAGGGTPEALEIQGSKEGDIVTSPWALPDGRAVLVSLGGGSSFDVALFDLATGELEVLAKNGFTPTYVATGHVLYQEGIDGPLMALPFDADRREVTGEAVPVVDDLGTRVSYQVRMFTVGGANLVYLPRSPLLDSGALDWIDRQGVESPIVEVDAVLDMPRISHDGRRVAFRIPAPSCDVWVHDLDRGATTRITFEGDNHGTAWFPDDQRIALARNGESGWEVLSVAADGAGAIERLAPPLDERAMVSDVSPDGRFLLLVLEREATATDVDLLELSSQSTTPLLGSRFDESAARFSPGGDLVSYVSNESGRKEVYVQSFPTLSHREQVSTQGGTEPVWSPAGDELFFRSGGQLMAVAISGGPTPKVGTPVSLFAAGAIPTSGFGLPSYDASADGQRFVVMRQRSPQAGAEVYVVTGWTEELRSLTRREPDRPR